MSHAETPDTDTLCEAVLHVAGNDYRCEFLRDHTGVAHSNAAANAIWHGDREGLSDEYRAYACGFKEMLDDALTSLRSLQDQHYGSMGTVPTWKIRELADQLSNRIRQGVFH